MKKILFILTCIVGMFSISCTEQQRVRNFGGTMTIDVEPGQEVMMATFKDEDLFYMTRPMSEDYVPTTKKLVESSSFGVLESTVIFKEYKNEK